MLPQNHYSYIPLYPLVLVPIQRFIMEKRTCINIIQVVGNISTLLHTWVNKVSIIPQTGDR